MRSAIAALLILMSAAAWTAPVRAPASPEVESCRAHGSIDTCYDALRRSPSDPTLLTALGDAFSRAKRPADALRTYKRAAALAPADRSLSAKIAALETKPTAKRLPALARTGESGSRRYSNAAPESQSH